MNREFDYMNEVTTEKATEISNERMSEIIEAELDGRLVIIPKGDYTFILTEG